MLWPSGWIGKAAAGGSSPHGLPRTAAAQLSSGAHRTGAEWPQRSQSPPALRSGAANRARKGFRSQETRTAGQSRRCRCCGRYSRWGIWWRAVTGEQIRRQARARRKAHTLKPAVQHPDNAEGNDNGTEAKPEVEQRRGGQRGGHETAAFARSAGKPFRNLDTP